MSEFWRVPRRRGAVAGVLLVLLGVWGALVPFVGPYADYAYTPDSAWEYTLGRLCLEILPGAGAILGGLLVLSSLRALAVFGSWLAAASGAWFVLGPTFSVFDLVPDIGDPTGGTTAIVVQQIGFFDGLGVAIVFCAALACGRLSVIGAQEIAVAPSTPDDETAVTPEPERPPQSRLRHRHP